MANISKDLSEYAQAVWKEPTNEGKYQLMEIMLDACRFQDNLTPIRRKVNNRLLSNRQLDKLAADLMLCDKDKVIK